MRPPVLNPLFRPVSSLAGIGPKLAVTLRKLLGGPDPDGEPRAIDLLFHLPVAVIDRSRQPGIALSPEGAIVTLKVRIDRHQKPPRGNRRIPYRVFVHDETGELALTFFHANEPWLERMLPVGETR
ncbi:MAG: ATP-dependent DNA helicase RecG, partial [Bauldia litoralis]